jgi:hypothetical protein
MVGLTECCNRGCWTAERLWSFRFSFSNGQIDSAFDLDRQLDFAGAD